jgi:integrase
MARSTANVYKPKNSPFWYYEFVLGGRRFRGTTGVTTKREATTVAKAERQREERKAAAREVVTSPAVSLHIGHAAFRYWEEEKGVLAGARNIWRDLERHTAHFGPETLLTDIDDAEVTGLVLKRSRDRGIPKHGKRAKEDCPFVSAGTVNHTITRLQAVFSHAKAKWKDGSGKKLKFPDEPDWKEHKLDVAQKDARIFRGDEKARFDKATRPDFVPVFGFAYESAKRMDYCASLRWSQVHWEQGVISKPGKRKPGGKEKIETVSITPEIEAILRPLVGHHPEFVFAYAAKRTRGGRLKGVRYPITASYLETEMKRTRQRAGNTKFGFHSFRRSGATEFYDATGNDLLLTQLFLGHGDAKTTARYILRDDNAVRAGMKKRAAKRVAAPNTEAAQEVPIPTSSKRPKALCEH